MTGKECVIPRIVIGGTHSGSGKTTLSLALMALLYEEGFVVRPCKVGPDHIDPSFHTFVTKVTSCSLDAWLVPPARLQHLFFRHACPCTTVYTGKGHVAIIEGVMGLFDGYGLSHEGSTAHVAELLQAPIVLVVDGRGLSRSAAALVAGYAAFSPRTHISGVVFTRLGSERHYRLLERSVRDETGIASFGYVQEDSSVHLHRRHLGLIPQGEVAGLNGLIQTLVSSARSTLDWQGIVKLAEAAPVLTLAADDTCAAASAVLSDVPLVHAPATAGFSFTQPMPLRIGYFSDKAFCLYYPDNLTLLQEMGAELIPISPLDAGALPPLDGMYMGSGFPEVFAAQLSSNTVFMASLKALLERGMPAYAECGSLVYLMQGMIAADNVYYPFVGFFDGQSTMTQRLQPFGYVTVTTVQDTFFGPAGTTFRAHEFHYSNVSCTGDPVYIVEKAEQASWQGGYSKNNVLAAHQRVHFYTDPALACSFLAKCRQWRGENLMHKSEGNSIRASKS